jgi:hypothetical protein
MTYRSVVSLPCLTDRRNRRNFNVCSGLRINAADEALVRRWTVRQGSPGRTDNGQERAGCSPRFPEDDCLPVPEYGRTERRRIWNRNRIDIFQLLPEIRCVVTLSQSVCLSPPRIPPGNLESPCKATYNLCSISSMELSFHVRAKFADEPLAGVRLAQFENVEPVYLKGHSANLQLQVCGLFNFKAAEGDMRLEIHTN